MSEADGHRVLKKDARRLAVAEHALLRLSGTDNLLQRGPGIEEAHGSGMDCSLAVGLYFVPNEFPAEVPVQIIEDGHPGRIARAGA
ncbi:hypothetical protein [Burkholderia multivorans]|uniref:hypothetical protein n=1 Tax=Burkholderia multivorans TaxID=87883 RepID=UPI0021C0FDD5|nr:hypothetical protein [Burkholderia multivorans]